MKILTAFILFFLSSSMVMASMKTDIDRIISSSGQPAHVGIVIQDSKTKKILYSQDDHYLFIPASVQKLLTAIAAITYMGPDFHYKTELLSKGSIIADHTLEGDVIIKFSGDPELSVDDLQQLFMTLKNKGITHIHGQIKIDTSTYDNIPYPPGWLWEDLSYYYAAPLTTAIVGKNKFVLSLIPASHDGEALTLNTNLPNSIIHFVNQTQTHAATDQSTGKLCPLTIYSDSSNQFILRGCVNKKYGKQYRSLALRDPMPYIRYIITGALADAGISHSEIRVASETVTETDSYTVLAAHTSPPLAVIVKHMLKKSDNLIADSLLKQIGYQYYKEPGSWENGTAALKKILGQSTGIDFNHGLINDGAGLSRYNLISPYDLILLLQYAHAQPAIRDILMDALPIAGIDGTLAGRMPASAKEHCVHAKTGSMTGVSALAGYLQTHHLGHLTFAIMVNGFVGKARHFSRVEDKICDYLVRTQQHA